MTFLDADAPGGLRAHAVDEKSHGWATRRSWVKTDLLAAARSTTNPATNAEDHVADTEYPKASEKSKEQPSVVKNALAAKNAREEALTGAPMAEWNIDDSTWNPADRAHLRANLIVDVIDLLDDHLDLTAAVAAS